MKKQFIYGAVLSIILSILTGCGIAGGSNSLSVKTKDGESKTFDIKTGKFITKKDRVTSGEVTEHLVCLADYEMNLPEKAKSYDIDKNVEEGQSKVCFELNGQEGYNENAEIKTGKYEVASFAGGYTPNAVGLATKIYTYQDGKSKKTFLKPNGTKGDVEITSASADKISGNINLSDGDNEVKGSFTADRIKGS